jgi:predicted DNA-binding transcriptional regulator AlpA
MKLLGITDLVKRWNYTKQGIYQKLKQDENFPKPIAIVNKNTLVFLEEDIIPYEQKRKELTDSNYKLWHTHKKWLYKEKMGGQE